MYIKYIKWIKNEDVSTFSNSVCLWHGIGALFMGLSASCSEFNDLSDSSDSSELVRRIKPKPQLKKTAHNTKRLSAYSFYMLHTYIVLLFVYNSLRILPLKYAYTSIYVFPIRLSSLNRVVGCKKTMHIKLYERIRYKHGKLK